MVWEIAKATGWSVRYILWGVNYPTLVLMMADGVRYITEDQEKSRKKGTSALGFFQTMLNPKNEKK